MLVQLLFGLLTEAPVIVQDVEGLVGAIKSSDGGEQTLKIALGGVQIIAGEIEKALGVGSK